MNKTNRVPILMDDETLKMLDEIKGDESRGYGVREAIRFSYQEVMKDREERKKES